MNFKKVTLDETIFLLEASTVLRCHVICHLSFYHFIHEYFNSKFNNGGLFLPKMPSVVGVGSLFTDDKLIPRVPNTIYF